MTVTKLSHLTILSDEDIVDFGIGSPEERRDAAERIDARKAASRAVWAALPWWTRVARMIRARRLIRP